jgi:hypothetical protein
MGDESVGPPAGSWPASELQIQLHGRSSGEVGHLLDELRPHLLAIALEELPQAPGGKLGASDLAHETTIRAFRNVSGTHRGRICGLAAEHSGETARKSRRGLPDEKRNFTCEQPADRRLVQNGHASPTQQD